MVEAEAMPSCWSCVYLSGLAKWRRDSLSLILQLLGRRWAGPEGGLFFNYILSTRINFLLSTPTPLSSSGLKSWWSSFLGVHLNFHWTFCYSYLCYNNKVKSQWYQATMPFLLSLSCTSEHGDFLCLENSPCHCATVSLLVISHSCVLVPGRGSIWKVKLQLQFQERTLSSY